MRRKPNGCLSLPPSSVFEMKKRENLRGPDFVMVERIVREWQLVGVGLIGIGLGDGSLLSGGGSLTGGGDADLNKLVSLQAWLCCQTCLSWSFCIENHW